MKTLAPVLLASGLAATSAHAAVLFADTFGRANNTNLNASSTGKSGTLGALNWVEANTGSGASADASVNGGALQLSNGAANVTSYAVPYVDNNFTGLTGFEVSFDFTSAPPQGGVRTVGIGIGSSKAQLDTLASSVPSASSEVVFGFDVATTASASPTGVNIFQGGTQVGSTIVRTVTNGTTLRGVFTFDDMLTGTTIDYSIYFGTEVTPIYTGSTTWTGDNQNYIAVFNTHSSGNAGSVTKIDNFSISEIPEPASLALFGLGGLLVGRRQRRA